MAKEPFMLVSLKEDKAKKLSHVLSNKSATKILEYLSGKDATESQIAKTLKIPLSTVNYNMKLLVEAKLVVCEEFHYSEKGKEVNHYKLANKYIIIAPAEEDTSFLKHLQKFLPVAVVVAALAIILRVLNRWAPTSTVSQQFVAEKTLETAEYARDASDMAMDGAPAMAMEAAEEVATPTVQNVTENITLVHETVQTWQFDATSAVIGAALMLILIILLTYYWQKR